MAEVLYGSLKHNGKSFEAGTLASKLPKKAREHARNVGFLVQEVKEPKEEVYEDVDEDDDEVVEVDEE